MKKRNIGILLAFFFILGTLFSATTAEGAVSVASLQKENSSLKSQLSKKDKEIRSLKSQVSSKNKEISSLKSQLASKNKEISSLKSQLASKNKEIGSLKSQTKSLTTKVTYQEKTFSGNYKEGNTTVPVSLSYKGVHYMPVSLVGKLFNLPIKFDSKKNTTFIGPGAYGLMMSDIIGAYYGTDGIGVDRNNPFVMGGVNYSKGYIFSGYGERKFAFNLSGKYTTITGLLGFKDDSIAFAENTTVSFYGDGKYLSSTVLIPGNLPTDVTIPVKGVKKLEIAIKTTSCEVGFANVKIN